MAKYFCYLWLYKGISLDKVTLLYRSFLYDVPKSSIFRGTEQSFSQIITEDGIENWNYTEQ